MFEFEVESAEVDPRDVPAAVLESFVQAPPARRSLLAWGEHCTECAMPQCYQTCDLYQPRSDRKCRRFVDGIVKIKVPGSAYGHITRITFKRWGALWSPGSRRVYKHAGAYQRLYQFLARGVRKIDGRWRIGAWNVHRVFSYLCKAAVRVGRRMSLGRPAEYFLVQVYNPAASPISFTLKMTSNVEQGGVPLLKLLKIDPGYHEVVVPLDEINAALDVDRPFTISLVPNGESGPVTAYFGLIDFIRPAENAPHRYSERKIKCLVWDLDNTLWDGTLAESDPAALRLKDGVAEILEQLDRRGILLSIASKNDPDQAMEVLKRFGLDHYFLSPQIGWRPKSDALMTIARELNLGLDALAFIDDSNFERAEVARAVPEVLTIDAINVHSLLHYPCLRGSQADDAARRRTYYRDEQHRKKQLRSAFANHYAEFLKSCRISVTVSRPSPENLGRIHDLIQRTNQMNFSPQRYTREEVARILDDEHLEKYVLAAADRFGEYGVIGFSVVDPNVAHMTDLLFSCRVQTKRIEHAFLAYMLRKHRDRGDRNFKVTYVATDRNAQSGCVFDDLGFEPTTASRQDRTLSFDLSKPLPEEKIVTIREQPCDAA